MPGTSPRLRKLAADDWIAAALRAIAEDGLDAVAVEPLAKRLGATKGSFYWHFANRRELLVRAVQAWEREHTDAIIDLTDRAADAPGRINDLLDTVFASVGDRLELALLAAPDDPDVSPVVARVAERRIAYVADLYRSSGMDEPAARSTAVAAVAAFIGHAQLAAVAPNTLPSGNQWQVHVAHLRRLFAPD